VQGKTLNYTQTEKRLVKNEWAAELQKRNTTITGSVWQADSGTLTLPTYSGSLTQVLIASPGSGQINNTVTLANGETLVNVRLLNTLGWGYPR
jgi:hypothetical protein